VSYNVRHGYRKITESGSQTPKDVDFPGGAKLLLILAGGFDGSVCELSRLEKLALAFATGDEFDFEPAFAAKQDWNCFHKRCHLLPLLIMSHSALTLSYSARQIFRERCYTLGFRG
jgi:hypothetical protein